MRRDGVYNFTTEGLYPECYLGMRRYGGKLYETLFDKLEKALLDGLDNPNFRWGIIQQYTATMIDRAMLADYPTSRFEMLIEEGIRRGLMISEWRGIHIFSRILPKNYFLTELLAKREMLSHKAWLDFWDGVCIDSATASSNKATITVSITDPTKARIVVAVSEFPKSIRLNGKKIPFKKKRQSKIEFSPKADGRIEIDFS